jgi:hypothetical protein
MGSSEAAVRRAGGDIQDVSPEPFVDVAVAAKFLSLTPCHIKKMARRGEIPAYPIGLGQRKTWRFRLSEISAQIETLKTASRGR